MQYPLISVPLPKRTNAQKKARSTSNGEIAPYLGPARALYFLAIGYDVAISNDYEICVSELNLKSQFTPYKAF
jgi:hypothetical protein